MLRSEVRGGDRRDISGRSTPPDGQWTDHVTRPAYGRRGTPSGSANHHGLARMAQAGQVRVVDPDLCLRIDDGNAGREGSGFCPTLKL